MARLNIHKLLPVKGSCIHLIITPWLFYFSKNINLVSWISVALAVNSGYGIIISLALN